MSEYLQLMGMMAMMAMTARMRAAVAAVPAPEMGAAVHPEPPEVRRWEQAPPAELARQVPRAVAARRSGKTASA